MVEYEPERVEPVLRFCELRRGLCCLARCFGSRLAHAGGEHSVGERGVGLVGVGGGERGDQLAA